MLLYAVGCLKNHQNFEEFNYYHNLIIKSLHFFSVYKNNSENLSEIEIKNQDLARKSGNKKDYYQDLLQFLVYLSFWMNLMIINGDLNETIFNVLKTKINFSL